MANPVKLTPKRLKELQEEMVWMKTVREKEVADLIPKSEFLALPRMGHDLPPIHFETITRAIASHVWQAEA